MSLETAKIALVHDELTRRGGAEIVLEELLRMFPQAHVYALYAGKPRIAVDGRVYEVRTSFLQNFPIWFRRHPRRLLPFLPHAAEQFDFSDYDVVMSSASGFAKAIVTRSTVPHISYCHTPTRYLWDSTHQVLARASRFRKVTSSLLFHYLRLSDFTAAQRVDRFLANSEYTQERIYTYYRRKSTVIYPPIDTAFYTPGKQGRSPKEYFLLVGRLTPTKNFDQAIRVCEKMKIPLIVVGTGHDRRRLQALAQGYTTFVGRISREKLREYYRGARALVQPGPEDFGMASAEALACGTPVIAYNYGGVREIVQPYTTGFLYHEPHEEALAEAIRQSLPLSFSAGTLQHSVLKFSIPRFRDSIYKHIQSAVQ